MSESRENPVLYCVDVAVATSAAARWRVWMTQTHIPAVLASGCFGHAYFTQAGSDADAERFAIIYLAPGTAELERYRREFGPALQADHLKEFGEHVTATRRELIVMGVYHAGAPQG